MANLSAPRPKPWIEAISPYVPGRSSTDSGIVAAKLSSNENPLGTSPAAKEAFAAAAGTLGRYPDGSATALRQAIADRFGLDPARIIYGTGSDEILHLAAGAYAGVGDEILFVRYGFSVYPIATRRVGATPVEAPDKDYATDVDALLTCVTDRTRVVFLANPNNPTGTFLPRGELRRLHRGLPADCLLVIDQAYYEYVPEDEDDGGFDLARTEANVLVTRTFSKIHGLAAERIGWGYGSAEVVNALHKIRAPFNVTTAGQHAAIAATHDTAFVAASQAHNARWREWLQGEIAALGNAGIRAVPSKANFVLVLFEGALTGEQAFEGLMARGLITRWLPGQELPHGLRISIGTEDEMRRVVGALRELVEATP
jgi:histidinol-phosphate aminotransferase